MRFVAGAPVREADRLVWLGRWEGFTYVLLTIGPLAVMGLRGQRDGVPWFSLVAFVAMLFLYFRGPSQRVTFDMKQREIRIVAEGLFAEPGERTIRFEHVRTLVVTPMPRRRSTLVVRTAEGDVELLHLGRVYANEQAIAELRAMFSA